VSQRTADGPAMTVLELLETSSTYLTGKRVASPRLDAEVMLAQVLELDRIHLYVSFDRPVSTEERDQYREMIRRRAAREPVALILGVKEFRSREFTVEPGVLIPRPDTELLADLATERLAAETEEPPLVLDLGCGSGILAISIAADTAETCQAKVLAVDRSTVAMKLTRANSERHGVADRVGTVGGDWWDAVPERFAGSFDLIVSNPPYVAADEHPGLEPEIVEFEPYEALVPPGETLSFYRRTADGLGRWLKPGGVVLLEVGAGQAFAVEEMLVEAGCTSTERHLDLAGIERVVEGKLGE